MWARLDRHATARMQIRAYKHQRIQIAVVEGRVVLLHVRLGSLPRKKKSDHATRQRGRDLQPLAEGAPPRLKQKKGKRTPVSLAEAQARKYRRDMRIHHRRSAG